jgi:NAD(P)-dependent dehydrogenase (short-subunit alcohol dehydrogenase family)
MDDLSSYYKLGWETNVTPTVHRTSYPAISPTRPELSQAGKTVLITGGSRGIGKAIARAFTLASAANIVIVARSADELKTAAAELEEIAEGAHSPTKVIARQVDVAKDEDVEGLWDHLAALGITVDVLVLCAVRPTQQKPLFDLGIKEAWSEFEANVKGPLHLAEKFYKQPSKSSQQVNLKTNPKAMCRVTIHPVNQH